MYRQVERERRLGECDGVEAEDRSMMDRFLDARPSLAIRDVSTLDRIIPTVYSDQQTFLVFVGMAETCQNRKDGGNYSIG